MKIWNCLYPFFENLFTLILARSNGGSDSVCMGSHRTPCGEFYILRYTEQFDISNEA